MRAAPAKKWCKIMGKITIRGGVCFSPIKKQFRNARRRFELQYKIFFPLFMPKRAFKSVLLARQQHRQHGFLDVETVLRFVKDLVRVLLE